MQKLGVLLLTMLAATLPARAGEPATYTLVHLKTGPQSGKLSEADNKAAFAGHFANMQRLAGEKKLLVAGPFGAVRHDDELRGLFVLNTAKVEEAKEWAASDPAAKAGLFVLEYHPIRTAADLLGGLEKDLERENKAKAEGRQLEHHETMRAYVWLTAEDGAKARAAIAPLVEQKKVFLVADLDESRLLVLLDALTAAKAKEQWNAAFEAAGPHQLDEWYGSNLLATP
jgi:uncharacterized protein YciI